MTDDCSTSCIKPRPDLHLLELNAHYDHGAKKDLLLTGGNEQGEQEEDTSTMSRPLSLNFLVHNNFEVFPEIQNSIKRQLSQSLNGLYSGNLTLLSASSGSGIVKRRSRHNSSLTAKSELLSDHEEEEEEEAEEEEEEEGGRERKRRDNINERIKELLFLIPPEYFKRIDDGANNSNKTSKTSNEDAVLVALQSSGTRDGKPNKGQILSKLIVYLHDMQNLIDENNRREVELRAQLSRLKMGDAAGMINGRVAIEYTTAEEALGEIGVGPLSRAYFKHFLQQSQTDASCESHTGTLQPI